MIEGKTKVIEDYKDGLVKITTKDVLTANDAMKRVEMLAIAIHKTEQTCNVFDILQIKNVSLAYQTRIHPRTFVAKKCDMIPLEVVVRRHAYGSYLKRNPNVEPCLRFEYLEPEYYHKLAFVNGEMISEDLARERYMRTNDEGENEWTAEVVTDPFILFNWKEWQEAGADYNSKEKLKMDIHHPKQPILEKIHQVDSVITPREIQQINEIAQNVFVLLENMWAKFNVTLADMKMEFGKDQDGNLLLADVIDNDSWRIWPNGNPSKQLDKQSFRDGEVEDVVQTKYDTVTKYTGKFLGKIDEI